jgi:lipopolysaccharide/colanic/teichoic acid biosynthesis glycosyltransferase
LTHRFDAALKRLFDVGVSAIALALLLPVMAIVALVVRWQLGRPILFRQQRPGLHGRPFIILKFRTMRSSSAVPAGATDGDRLSGTGRLLRSLSLDELPQLLNVLKGDMSLVGPRPLLMQYMDRYTHTQARRHEVRPGMTGWAQINGRNVPSWEERFAMDVWYVEHQSLWLDLRILARTIASVASRQGINAPGEATMHEFHGSER